MLDWSRKLRHVVSYRLRNIESSLQDPEPTGESYGYAGHQPDYLSGEESDCERLRSGYHRKTSIYLLQHDLEGMIKRRSLVELDILR